MDIKSLRQYTNLSQRQFATKFGIPIGTLRNWEQGIAKPPEYVYQMIIANKRRDHMINLETIKFISLLNELALKTQNGIDEFENATQDNLNDQIFYDKKTKNKGNHYKLVLDACVIDDPKCIHHDIVSYYDDISTDYTIYAVVEENEASYIEIILEFSDESIIVENGTWYCS